MNSNQNDNARTREDTRRKTNTAANTINAFFNNKTKMTRQEAIEDKRQLYEEEIEYDSKRGGSDSRRHQRKLRNAAKTIMLLGSGNEDSTTEEDNRRWKTATWSKINSNHNENARTIEDT